MTARLMSLAEPGQTLLTKTAFDSARQSGRVGGLEGKPRRAEPSAAQGELCWLNHGWYRFKGADEPFEVCEVGVSGESPLRAPADSEKARRVAPQKPAAQPFRDRAKRHFREVFVRRPTHWLAAMALTAAGMALGHFFKTNESLFGAQYKIFEFIEEHAARPLRGSHAAVVLVDDDAYYKSEAAGRAPINRRYLARVVGALGELNPAAIALDFDFRAPNPSGRATATSADGVRLPEHPEYVDETVELLKTLSELSSRLRIPVILPATIGKAGDEFVKEADVYDGFDFGAASWTKGYIALDTDTKVIPPTKRLADGTQLDSFSLAIVRSVDEEALEGDQWSASMYGGFIRGDGILQVKSGAVLNPENAEPLRKRVRHKAVLVGGAWHRLGYARGPLIDSYDSPAGFIPGVLIHANYVEAVLDRRVVLPLSDWVVVPAEGLLAFSLAYALALPSRPWLKACAVTGLLVLPIACSYVAVQNFGVYFDVLIVNILLLGHFFVEKLMEWRQGHRRWLAYAKTSTSGAET
jgi:CHASE2 domain-containing sensor protein